MGNSLEGRRILVTRAAEQNQAFIKEIEREGGEALVLPMIEMLAVENQSEIAKAFENLDQVDWLVFTSTNAVRFFFEAAEQFKIKFYFYPNLKIATLGEATKLKLEQLGFRTNFVPIEFTAEVLAENMDEDLRGKQILIPRSSKAKNNYLEVFEKRGAKPIALEIYENRDLLHPKDEMAKVLDQQPDSLTFTSGSTLKSFVKNLERNHLPFPSAAVYCIGPSTAKVAEELNIQVHAVAKPHTEEALLNQLKEIHHV